MREVVHGLFDPTPARGPGGPLHATAQNVFSPAPMLANWRTRKAEFALPETDDLQPTEERFMFLLRKSLSRKPENKLTEREKKVRLCRKALFIRVIRCAHAWAPDRSLARATTIRRSRVCSHD